MALSQESLGFMLAIDKCGRNCQHCPAYGLRQKTETAPFDDLQTRLKIAHSALNGTGVIQKRTIHAWRIGDLLDYKDLSSGTPRTVADIADAWRSSLGQPLYTVTNGTMGTKWRQEALENLVSEPDLNSQIKLTITPFDPKFPHKNYVPNMAHDVAALWPLAKLSSLRPESEGQSRFRINVKTSEAYQSQTEAVLRQILSLSGVNIDIDKAVANETELVQIKSVYDLRINAMQPLASGALALSSTIENRLKPEHVRSQNQLGFRPNGEAFEVDLWAFSEADLIQNGTPQTFDDWFPVNQ